MVEITFFAHATTTDNERGLATGWLPGELSAVGIQQARELGGLVAGSSFNSVFCSDLKRAIDSAELGFGLTRTIIKDARLREANYGDFNGKPDSFKDDLKRYIDTPFPRGESYRGRVEPRMRSFCDFLKLHYIGKHVAIVAHQGPQLALDVILGGKTWEQAIYEDWRHTHAWKPGWHYTIP